MIFKTSKGKPRTNLFVTLSRSNDVVETFVLIRKGLCEMTVMSISSAYDY